MVECCFTSTETVGLLGTGAQDVHLDFHTAPELCWPDQLGSDDTGDLCYSYLPFLLAGLTSLAAWSDDTGDSCYRYPLFMLAGLINLGLMVVMYKWTPDDGDMAFIFLAPICWGLSEGIWMTQTNCE